MIDFLQSGSRYLEQPMEENDLHEKQSKDRRRESLSEEDAMKMTAIHEAAHAVFLVLFELGNRGASIEGDESRSGFALGPNQELQDRSRPDGFLQMQKHIIMLLAGAEAVKLILPEYRDLPQGDESDVEEAEIVLERMVKEYHPSFRDVSLEMFREVAREHLGDLRFKSVVINLANQLLDKGTMSGEEVEGFVKEEAKWKFGDVQTRVVEDIRNRLTHARLCYQVWWLFKEDTSRRSRIVGVLNNYPELFRTADPAFFCTWVLKLSSLFDKSEASINLRSIPHAKNDVMFSNIWERGRRLYRYRSKMIAHRDGELFEKDFAGETQFKLKDFGKLIEDTCDLFDRCVSGRGPDPIDRFDVENDVERLVEDLSAESATSS